MKMHMQCTSLTINGYCMHYSISCIYTVYYIFIITTVKYDKESLLAYILLLMIISFIKPL